MDKASSAGCRESMTLAQNMSVHISVVTSGTHNARRLDRYGLYGV